MLRRAGIVPTILTLVLLTSVLCIWSGEKIPQKRMVRRCCDGDVWLSWSKAEQLAFTKGFLEGLRRGHRDGCSEFDEITQIQFTVQSPEEIPLAKCMKKELLFSKDFDFYVKHITNYYGRFPMDKDVQLSDLFRFLSDTEGKSDEEIHSLYSK